MVRAIRSGLLVLSMSAAAVACGGSLADIPDPEGDGGANDVPTASPPSTGTGLPVPDASPPPPFDAGRPDGSRPDGGRPDGGRPDGGPFPIDASLPPTDAGPPPVDAATPPGPIACGASSCDSATQTCCIQQGGATCIAKGATCQGGALACSSASSCGAGEVCCASLGGAGGGGAACRTTCGPTGIQLCDSDAECTAPETCQPAVLGLKTCRRTFGPPPPPPPPPPF